MEAPPLKRARIDGVTDKKDEWVPIAATTDDDSGGKFVREVDCGITEYVNREFKGFDCILKYKLVLYLHAIDSRYEDFVVNEVGLDGQVIVLKNTKYDSPSNGKHERSNDEKPVRAPPFGKVNVLAQEEVDLTPLSDLFPPDTISQLHALYTSKGTSPSEVHTDPQPSKDTRTLIHRTLRTVFHAHLDSQATSTNAIRVTYPYTQSSRSRHQPNAQRWPEGEYVLFTLKKANRDTMATSAMLAKWLGVHNKVLGYAGTKDRRAVSTQRMSAHRIRPERLAGLNKQGNGMGIWVGDFQFSKAPVKLGDLSGNEFIITLREVSDSVDVAGLERAIESLRTRGFINYYGMQRFGTSPVSTHSIGALLLNGQWKAACELILDVKGGGMNDSIEGRELYFKGDIEGAWEKMPRRCIAERAILGVLKINPKHYSGALQAVSPIHDKGDSQQIPRNLRLMYVHAYQSYVWNVVASARMRLGTNLLEGDLVLVNSIPEEASEIDDPDQGGEFSIAEPESQDKVAVKVVTQEDVNSGTYTIHDIVLPTPGYDVTYPSREELRQAYINSMSRDGLDPFNMRRVVREVSMVGHYRRVIHRPENVQWEIIRYNGKDTILDNPDDLTKDGELMALRIQLRLGTSQYATMALREICKHDSVQIQFWGKERDEQEKERKLEAEKLERSP